MTTLLIEDKRVFSRFVACGGYVIVEAPKDICDAVTERFQRLYPAIEQRTGDYVYDGMRTEADQLGWRFIQSHGEMDPRFILGGGADDLIVETYHEAAASQHYYDFEKDWGSFDFDPFED